MPCLVMDGKQSVNALDLRQRSGGYRRGGLIGPGARCLKMACTIASSENGPRLILLM